MNLNELKIAELKALYALIRERDAEIERLSTIEQQAINWAKLAGKNQKQIEKLADKIERLTSELNGFKTLATELTKENQELRERLEGGV